MLNAHFLNYYVTWFSKIFSYASLIVFSRLKVVLFIAKNKIKMAKYLP